LVRPELPPVTQDLERLIALQRLDAEMRDAERRIAEEPSRQQAFDARVEEQRTKLASAKQALADNQNARREFEKDVAVQQGRLSKFREQAMAVKTNQEYHAIQHEIAFAESEIKAIEDKILEVMVAADDLNAAVKQTEVALASQQKAVEAERKALAGEIAALKTSLDRVKSERAALAAQVDRRHLATFELVSTRRNGIAVAEARDGICTVCHVRLRPQVFNTIRRNEEILQCDSCNRILYFVPPVPAATESVSNP
jgi:predicted  nucleic acid-binding Zn-ribbon protein